MLTFSVTIYGDSEHAERNAAQELWHALDETQNTIRGPLAMLIGEAKYQPDSPTQKDAADLQAH